MVQIMHLRQEYQRGDAMFWLYYIKWHTISVCPLLVTFALVTWLWWCLAAMWSYTFSPSWFKSILQGCTFALSSSLSLHKLWIHSLFSLYQYGLMASHFNQQDTINVCHDSFATKNYFVDFLVGFWVLLTCPHLSLTMSLILVRQKFQVCLLFLLSSLGNRAFLVLDSPSFSRWAHILGSAPLGPPPTCVTVTQSPVLFLPFCRAEFLHTITFLQPEKSSFKIFCWTDLMVVNSLSICSSWNIFTLLSFGRAFFLDRWCTGDSLLLWHFIDVAVSSALLCFWWASESVSRWVMSDSLRPHGLWLARLLCPWNSPGKNTGVGCCALL